MFAAEYFRMAIRTFTGSDGQQWTAWVASAGSVGRWLGAPSEWLVFQNEDDTERRRMLEIPPQWEELSELRLDLLRRVAAPVVLYAHRHSPPAGVDRTTILSADEE